MEDILFEYSDYLFGSAKKLLKSLTDKRNSDIHLYYFTFILFNVDENINQNQCWNYFCTS